MPPFTTTDLPEDADAVAPDGTEVRVLGRVPAGSLAHFTLAPGAVSVAVRHRTVAELWYFVSGTGQLWRRGDAREEVVDVRAGTAASIPVGTSFQLRSTGREPLRAVGTTMPPWPGPGEVEFVTGPWAPTVAPGPA